MGRGRVQLRRIENKISRQVTFSKRRNGLMKKAAELSILCDAEVALIVFSNKDKLYEFASSSMTKILERYRKRSNLIQDIGKDPQNSDIELTHLKEEVDRLQRSRRHLLGEDLHQLGATDLQHLEQQLEEALQKVTLTKTQFMLHLIEELRRKEQLLEGINKSLLRNFSELEGQYPRDHYSLPISGRSLHSTTENYPQGEPTLQIGCPSALTGITTTAQRQSRNYDAEGWMV